MKFKPGNIEGIVIRSLVKHSDNRGWLMELFRDDEVAREFRPAMAYISVTKPGVVRGPHEHRDQADFFCIVGPSVFRVYLWDNRRESSTFLASMKFEAGQDNPEAIIVPAGVVHAYKNIGLEDGIIINLPNRLFAGEGRKEAVDEIRHENDPRSLFIID